MTTTKNIIISAILVLSSAVMLSAYEWPVEDMSTSTIVNHFGRNAGNTISTSMIFSEPKQDPKVQKEEGFEPVTTFEVNTIEKGSVIAVIQDFEDSNVFFPSTLGNAVIISHENSLISVYGNLDRESVEKNRNIQRKIGNTGKSAWKNGKSTLELQIIDTNNNIAIDPLTILPRLDKEPVFAPTNIRLVNKNGKSYEFTTMKSLPQGTYRVYQTVSNAFMPHKTHILLNGNEEDYIAYDNVKALNNKKWVKGKNKNFPNEQIYPDSNSLFSGEVVLMPGKSVLTVSNESWFGDEKQTTLNLTVY